MKTAVSVLLALLFCPVYGQITLKNNAPRPGDEIIKQQVEYKDPGRSGENVIWDFSSLKGVNPEYKLNYHSVPLRDDSIYVMGKDTILKNVVSERELIVGIEHMTMYYYRIRDNSMFLLGHENPVILMHHRVPLPVISYPFNFLDKKEGGFSSKGLYSAREDILTEGSIGVEADAYGKIFLPTGDTLNHVLRIKTVQHIHEGDSLKKQETNPLHLEMETYRWYVKGYRYPVFETVRSFHIQDTVRTENFNTAFFYPPQEHYYLSDDPENLVVLDSLWNEKNKGNPQDPNNPGGNFNWEDNLAYNFYPNPVVSDLHIEYLIEQTAEVVISVYDVNGRLLLTTPKENKLAGLYQHSIDCSNLSTGSYILRITVNNHILNNKFIKK